MSNGSDARSAADEAEGCGGGEAQQDKGSQQEEIF